MRTTTAGVCVAFVMVVGCGDNASGTTGTTGTTTAGMTTTASATTTATTTTTDTGEPTGPGTTTTDPTSTTTASTATTGEPANDHTVVGLELCTLSEPLPAAQNWSSNDIVVAADPAGTVLYVGNDETSIYRYTIDPGDDCVLTRDAGFGALDASHTALAVDDQKALYTALNNGYNVGRAWPAPEVNCAPEPYGLAIAIRPDGSSGVSAGLSGDPFSIDLLTFAGDTCTSSMAQWDLGSLDHIQDVALDAQGRVHVLGHPQGEPLYTFTVAVYEGGAHKFDYLNTGPDKNFSNAAALMTCSAGQTCVFSDSHGLARFDASGAELDVVEFDTFAGEVVLLDATGGGGDHVYIGGITDSNQGVEQRLIYRRTL